MMDRRGANRAAYVLVRRGVRSATPDRMLGRPAMAPEFTGKFHVKHPPMRPNVEGKDTAAGETENLMTAAVSRPRPLGEAGWQAGAPKV